VHVCKDDARGCPHSLHDYPPRARYSSVRLSLSLSVALALALVLHPDKARVVRLNNYLRMNANQLIPDQTKHLSYTGIRSDGDIACIPSCLCVCLSVCVCVCGVCVCVCGVSCVWGRGHNLFLLRHQTRGGHRVYLSCMCACVCVHIFRYLSLTILAAETRYTHTTKLLFYQNTTTILPYSTYC